MIQTYGDDEQSIRLRRTTCPKWKGMGKTKEMKVRATLGYWGLNIQKGERNAWGGMNCTNVVYEG